MTNFTESGITPVQFVFDRELIEKLDGSGPRYTSYPTADRFTDESSESIPLAETKANRRLCPICIIIRSYLLLQYRFATTAPVTRSSPKTSHAQIPIWIISSANWPCMPSTCKVTAAGPAPLWRGYAHLPVGCTDDAPDAGNRSSFPARAAWRILIEIDPRKSHARQRQAPPTSVSTACRSVYRTLTRKYRQPSTVSRVWKKPAQSLMRHGASGFKSVSIDLIYGLPHQTLESVRTTLETVLEIRPDRLAFYNYAHLPTLFMQRRINEADLPSPSAKLDILQMAVQTFLHRCRLCFHRHGPLALPDDDLAVALRQGRLQRNFQGYSTTPTMT